MLNVEFNIQASIDRGDNLPDWILGLKANDYRVIAQILQGKTEKSISADTRLSKHTVTERRKRIFEAAGVHDKVALIARVFQDCSGTINVDPALEEKCQSFIKGLARAPRQRALALQMRRGLSDYESLAAALGVRKSIVHTHKKTLHTKMKKQGIVPSDTETRLPKHFLAVVANIGSRSELRPDRPATAGQTSRADQIMPSAA